MCICGAIKRSAGLPEKTLPVTDYDLVWSENADALVAADKQVFETGRPITLEEFVDNSSQGKGDYYFNVCKWLNDIDGHPCCLGLSFIVEK